jgi:hypothetical protein
MKGSAPITIWVTTLAAVCVALAAFSLILPRPAILPPPDIDRKEHYKLFAIEGKCQYSLDYSNKTIPDYAIISSSFDKMLEAYERDFFNKVVDFYLSEQPIYRRLRIAIFGFSKADQQEIYRLFRRLMKLEYPPNLAWQVWGLCNQ